MKKLAGKYKTTFTDKSFVTSIFTALLLFTVSLLINLFASAYATSSASWPVGDIILDNIPVFKLDLVYAYGPILFWLVIAIVCFRDPKTLPFTLKAIALFVVVRSIFVTLTHLGVSPADVPIDAQSNFIKRLSYGGDLFFSGHTGLPFLISLVFKENKYLRIFCVISAIFFGAVVLMVHMHYSIDVLAAFFITYTVYCLAEIFFKADRKLFYS